MKPLTARQIIFWAAVFMLMGLVCIVGTTWWTLQPLTEVNP